MSDNNQPRHKSQFNAAAATAKPPLPSPSRKRLLVNFSATPSPQSSLSSDSSSDQLRKKTRELPNLSDCHCCKRHINHTNPKDRLAILDSAWRIVLLCKDCMKRVEFAEICSYCFCNVSDYECFRCCNCDRLIHKVCVVKYGDFPPWSYCHGDSRFLVCVDCWIPNSVGVCSSSRGRIGGKGLCDSSPLIEFNDHNVLEDLGKEAVCMAEKSFETTSIFKEDAMRTVVVTKQAAVLANGVLNLVDGDVMGGKNKSKSLEDEELALQLHRVINSSPRIAKNFAPVNYSCLGSRKGRILGFFEKIQIHAGAQLDEILDRTVSEHSVSTSACEDKQCQATGVLGITEAAIRECSSVVNNDISPVLRCYRRRDKQKRMLHSEVRSTQGICNSDVNGEMHHVFRYYQRRNKLKQMVQSKANGNLGINDSTLHFYRRRNRKCDRYWAKYRRTRTSKVNGETKNFFGRLQLRNHISDLSPLLNCSEDLKISPDAATTLQCCNDPRKSFAGSSGLCGQQLGK